MVKPSVVRTDPRGSPCIAIAQTFIMRAPAEATTRRNTDGIVAKYLMHQALLEIKAKYHMEKLLFTPKIDQA